MESFNRDVIFCIALKVDNIFNLSLVSKKFFNSVYNNKYLWMKKLEKDYKFLETMESCEEYRDCYLILTRNKGRYVSIHDDMHFGLNKACFRGYLPLVKYFLEDYESYSGLHFSLYNATKSGSLDVIKFLSPIKTSRKIMSDRL